MTGQKLTPEIPNARARTSVPTFIRDPVSDLPAFLYKLISKEHALVIKEFLDWVELWVSYFSSRVISTSNYMVCRTIMD